MKRARVAYAGAIHPATEQEGCVRLADGRLLAENDVVWLPPLQPGTIFALGLNYADHARELDFKAPAEPLVFLKGPQSLCGHLGHTFRPKNVTYMHYECELAVVIGKSARRVTKTNAYDYVAGYTIANDYTIRDYLENYYRPNFRVKSRDRATPIGPWLVDAADIADPMDLPLRTLVNGRVTQEGTTRDMIFDIPTIIAYLSEFMTLSPGDIILTGTPEGLTGVNVGDEVITAIDGIGSLKNTIIGEGQEIGETEEQTHVG
jgi:5-oxopent-3-ene-1,2,5-tricarboxylate decarboxylase/2-hydroxyhepta-2,4-diene-1,7-dioate isomerase